MTCSVATVTFVVDEVTFKVFVINSLVAKITFVVAEITFSHFTSRPKCMRGYSKSGKNFRHAWLRNDENFRHVW